MNLESVLDKYCKLEINEPRQPADPITFIESSWGLNRKLYPVQRFIVKLFYGLELEDKEKVIGFREYPSGELKKFTETEYLDHLSQIWYDGRARTNISLMTDFDNFKPFELVLICGRRGGKTHLISCITLYEVYKLICKYDPQGYYGLPEGDTIGVQIVASSEEQTSEEWTDIKSGLLLSPFFKPYIKNLADSEGKAEIYSPYDLERLKRRGDKLSQKLGSMVIQTSPCDADTIRGSGNIVVIFEELCHYKDKSKHRASRKVYDALQPSIAAFGNDGKSFVLSSPKDKDKTNKGYELYLESFSSESMLMFQIPTWEMNPKITFRFLKSVDRGRTFWQEYGARFADSTEKFLPDNERDIFMSCFRRDEKGELITVPNLVVMPGFNYYLTLDPSNKVHGYSGAIGHAENNLVFVDLIQLWYPEEFDLNAIDIEMIEDWIVDMHKKYKFKLVFFDQFESAYISQRLKKKHNIKVEVHFFTEKFNSMIYKTLIDLIETQRVSFYYHQEFVTQFLNLEKTLKPHNLISVKSKGGEEDPGDDIADAVAHLCYEIYTREILNKSKKVSTSARAKFKPSRKNILPSAPTKMFNRPTSVRRELFKGRFGLMR